MTTADLVLIVLVFLGFLSFASFVARYWPREWPGGDYAELDRRWND